MRTLGMLTAALAMSAVVVSAGKPAPTPPDIPVNLSFDNGSGQALASDGQTELTSSGGQADYVDGLQNVLAGISGNFRFSTQANSKLPPQRSACVDFGGQYVEGTVPFGNGSTRQCVNILEAMVAFPIGSGSGYIQTLKLGQSLPKTVRWEWQDGGYYYRLGYGSDANQNGTPETPPVTVTCIDAPDASSQCTKWTITPAVASGYATESSGGVLDPNAQTGTAEFWRVKILKGSQEGAPEFLGYYVMPFSQTLTPK